MTMLTDDVALAVDALARGELVAFPTETVYGLGADATNRDAVARVFAAKQRPHGHPLITHLADADRVGEWAMLDGPTAAMVDRLASTFWPGPLTLVVPSAGRAVPDAVGGLTTIGLRVPDHPVAAELLAKFGGGVVAPSANRFGRVSPTTAEHVLDDLDGLVDIVLDGGPTTIGVESTIIELVGGPPTLLRPGAVTITGAAAVLGAEVIDGTGGEARASGMLRSHYAPNATVTLVRSGPGEDVERAVERAIAETSLVTGSTASRSVGVIAPAEVESQPSWCLPPDAEGYARALYAALREADDVGVDRLLIVPPESGHLLHAVLDRLAKAAAPRPC